MLKTQDSTVKKVLHGYPNLGRIKESLKILYKHFSRETIHSFSSNILPSDVSILPGEDPVIAVHRLAGKLVRHLNLPEGSILINFRWNMENLGRVELTRENEYLVELHGRYREDDRDVAAVLAHEITHVFLYRAGLWLPNTYDNEILTDTASVYLGIGWLSLNAYRVTQSRHYGVHPGQVHLSRLEERIGYLTPEEFGYVLGKRAIAFSEKVDGLITSPAAKQAFKAGFRKAKLEYRQPPLQGCSLVRRGRYWLNRQWIRTISRSTGLKGLSRSFNGCQFDVSDGMKVVFECPACSQKLRLPIKKKTEARCGVCQSFFKCQT